MQTPNEMWLVYLSVLEQEGKDWTDPTFLMQAYGLSKKRAREVITYYRTTR